MTSAHLPRHTSPLRRAFCPTTQWKRPVAQDDCNSFLKLLFFCQSPYTNGTTYQKEKISLVISIVHNPDIIIFDEPTNGLDVITERIVVNFLKELREQGKCIIISSHIFSLIEKICDRVVIIIRGKSVCCDTLENVMAGQPLEDRFFELYENMEGKADE